MPNPVTAVGPVQAIDPVPVISPSQSPLRPATGAASQDRALSARRTEYSQRDVSILQASVDVSISSGNEPLALLLQTAIAGINDILAPEFGKNAVQNAASEDSSPEGTAERIVSLSTGFHTLFMQQHANEAPADVLKDFMAVIRSGFENGYREALDILQGMNVLNGEIASNIDKTYALVQQGYADFEAAHAGDQSAVR